MNPRARSTTWLPSTDQIAMVSERTILAALDATLLLTSRALLVQHSCLDDESPCNMPPDPPPPHLALASSILILAESLHHLIASYHALAGHDPYNDQHTDDPF